MSASSWLRAAARERRGPQETRNEHQERPITRRPDQGPCRQWTINGDFLGFKATGVARHGREVTLALDELVRERHPSTSGLSLEVIAPTRGSPPLDTTVIPVSVLPELRPRLPQVWVQCQLPMRVSGGLLSFGNLAPVALRRQIVCIHDLQTYTVPQSYGRLFRWMHRAILPAVGRNADFIATVSESSRQDLGRLGVAPRGNVVVVRNGADHVDRWRPDRAVLDWARPRPFVLGIGRNEAHKNAGHFVSLADSLARTGIDVVLVGDVDRAALTTPGRTWPENLHLLGRVSDDDLARGLQTALCFAFPSRAEGFGFPVLEALGLGCAVVTSRVTSLRDICGDAALYADADDVEAWAAAVRSLSAEPRLRESLIRRGRARTKLFTWRSVAEAYLKLMSEVDRPYRHGRGCPEAD